MNTVDEAYTALVENLVSHRLVKSNEILDKITKLHETNLATQNSILKDMLMSLIIEIHDAVKCPQIENRMKFNEGTDEDRVQILTEIITKNSYQLGYCSGIVTRYLDLLLKLDQSILESES